ncbi:MAG TPA: hypothetical protein ENO27_04655 [Caldithrix sp.]|nr:hypothetical protein [Bacteroidales bacterium]HEM49485.1 hypothetical protein [Caldithrix sp.]
MKNIKYILASVFVVLLFNTCEKDDTVKPSDKESFVYDVTYTDETVLIDSLLAESLVRIDSADYTYYFESNDPKILNLKADDILFIYGIALRRITNVTRNGNETMVETDYATLNEAIKDGEISWNKKISFSDGIVPVVQMKGTNIEYKSISGDSIDFEFKYGDYTYRIKFVFSDTRADILFEISKDLVKPITAKFQAKGYMENFYSKTEMEYKDSELTKFGQKNYDLKGELTLNLTVAGSGRDEINFELPVVLLKFPFVVYGIPVTINIKVLFVVNCVVPVDGSSQVEVRFEYNSTTGIKYNGIDVDVDASIGNQKMDKNIAQTGASTAIGANFGLAFPRLEVAVFGDKIVPYVQTAFLIGGDYTFTPPCQQAKSQFIGACGIDLSFLGFGYSAKHVFWQEEKVLLQAGECPEN